MSAIQYLGGINDLARRSVFKCESDVFRLHYQFTVLLILGSSIILTVGEFFGSPINCITELPQNVINTYCWIKATYTIQDFAHRNEAGLEPLPGIRTPNTLEDLPDDEQKWRFHNYYQWVVFFLLFEAGLFYFPKYIWSIVENGLMEELSYGLERPVYKETDVGPKKAVVIRYIVQHIKLNDFYVYKYWFCELLCFINVIGQLFMVDKFLGGEFFSYGPRWMDYIDKDQAERVDPMIYVFPRMTKCNFWKFGPSGTLQLHDSYCLLAFNIFNEKIFLMLWFWFVILAILFFALIVFRVLFVVVPTLRPLMLRQHNKGLIDKNTAEVLNNKIGIGDWWILYVLSANVEPHLFGEIIKSLAKEIEPNKNGYNIGEKKQKRYPSSAV